MKQQFSDSLVLLIEDSAEDTVAIIRAFEKNGITNNIIHFETGDDALDYLYRRDQYADIKGEPLPRLILLDLNLPGTDGRDVLKLLKNDKNFKKIPVVVITSSMSRKDLDNCYGLGANTYIPKPMSFDRLVDTISGTSTYWFDIAVVPKIGSIL